MAHRSDGERRHDDLLSGRAAERDRLFRGDERWRDRGPRDSDPAYSAERPIREWEHERSSGFRRGGDAYARSPRIQEPERYGYGSEFHRDDPREPYGFGLGRGGSDDWRQPYSGRGSGHYDARDDERRDWQEESPGELGERSYGGFGDYPGPEYEGIRMGREGYGGAGYERIDWPGSGRRSAAATWGLGRAGASRGWRNDVRRYRGAEEAQAGRYAGRGPQGYQRSDDRIREDVCDLLLTDSYIDASGLTVHVDGGEVTLEGTVHDRRMKRAAEDLVEEITGVTQVHNHLRIAPEASEHVTEITRNGGSRA